MHALHGVAVGIVARRWRAVRRRILVSAIVSSIALRRRRRLAVARRGRRAAVSLRRTAIVLLRTAILLLGRRAAVVLLRRGAAVSLGRTVAWGRWRDGRSVAEAGLLAGVVLRAVVALSRISRHGRR